MKLHRNAKSTPSSRLLLVRRVLYEGWSYAETAEGFAVSIRTVAKWVRRFKAGGVAALERMPRRDLARRPIKPHRRSWRRFGSCARSVGCRPGRSAARSGCRARR